MTRRIIQTNIKIGIFSAHSIDRIGDHSELRVEEVKYGGKIILPPSVFRRINRYERSFMIFKIINENLKKHIFCGVFTFDGEENKVLVPLWILKQLELELGNNVSVEFMTGKLEKGIFAKFEPLSNKFLDIQNPKHALETCLRNYVCITKEDIISIYYNRQIYELKIIETKPADTIALVDCDLEVDFAEIKQEEQEIDLPEDLDLDRLQTETTNGNNLFEPFSGNGVRTDGLKVVIEQFQPIQKQKSKRGVPDYDYKFGTLMFKRHKKDLIKSNDSTNTENIAIKTIKRKNQSKEQSFVNQTKNNNSSLQRRPVTRSQTALQNKQNQNSKKKKEDTNPNSSKNNPKNE